MMTILTSQTPPMMTPGHGDLIESYAASRAGEAGETQEVGRRTQ